MDVLSGTQLTPQWPTFFSNSSGKLSAESALQSGAEGSQGLQPALHVTLALYDAKGNRRSAFSADSAPAALSLRLPKGWIEIEATDESGGALRITRRADGSFLATDTRNGASATFDSRQTVVSDAASKALSDTAKGLIVLADQVAAGGDLASQAQDVVAQTLGAGRTGSVLIASSSGAAKISEEPAGVVTALRTTVETPLESVTVDGDIVIRSVRQADGTGQTSVAGLTIGEGADGSESVTFDPAHAAPTSHAVSDIRVVDALGNRISVSARGSVDVTDAAGTVFSLSTSAASVKSPAHAGVSEVRESASTTFSVTVGLGGKSGTARATIQDEANLGGQHQEESLTASSTDGSASSLTLEVASTGDRDTKQSASASHVAGTTSLRQDLVASGDLSLVVVVEENNGGQAGQRKDKTLTTSGLSAHHVLSIDSSSAFERLSDTGSNTTTGSATGFGSVEIS